MAQETLCAVYSFRFGRRASEYDVDDVKSWCKTWGKAWCFQKEQGDGGLVHYQGIISLVKKRRKCELLPMFERTEPHIVPEYFAPESNASIRAGTDGFYAMKTDTRIDGPWTDKDKVKFVPYHLVGITLRPWQQYIADSAKPENRNARTLDCIWDPEGNKGKSVVCDYIRIHHGGIDMPSVNDGDRLIASMCDILTSREERDPKIVMFDLPRAMPKASLCGIFTAIEQIKRGYVSDTRNHYREWEFHPPRVWIFTNVIPPVESLSMDRWRFWRIGEDQRLHATSLAEMLTRMRGIAASSSSS